MIPGFLKKLLVSVAAFLAILPLAQATVVRMDVAIGDTSTGTIYIGLYDVEAPASVANFLNYIDDHNGNRRYDGSIFHRSVNASTAGITIIQGGGYRYTNAQGFTAITTDNSIPNEYSAIRANNRGTLAMARLGPPPNPTPQEIQQALDSATSQWFINVIDNLLPDYTVFGRILGSGMDTVDAIAAKSTINLPPFTDLPTVNYTAGTLLTKSSLVTLTRVTASPFPPPLFVDPAPQPYDFGSLVWNANPAQQTVTLRNVGDTPLTLGAIDSAGTLAGTPFSITTSSPGDCVTDQVLAAFSSCTFIVLFNPTATGTFAGSFDIPFNDGVQNAISYSVSGTGAPAPATLEVSPPSSVNFGNIAFADFGEQRVTVRNAGGGTLHPVVTISGVNSQDFTISPDNNCPNPLALGIAESCSFTVRLTASTLEPAVKNATLTITDSTTGQSVQVQLRGNAVISQADLVLPTENALNIGDTIVGTPISVTSDFGGLPFGNRGTEALIFSDFKITGADINDFNIRNNDCQRVLPNQSCNIDLTFNPSSLGVKSAVLEISTNDPDTPIATLLLTASASSDNDGIADATEAAGPNNGDGNLDGIPDFLQENVTSLPGTDGAYITLESDVGTRLTRVKSYDNPSSGPLPAAIDASLNFPNGFFSFVIEDVVPIGSSATLTLYLPENQAVANTYFKYSHWTKTGSSYQYNPLNWFWGLFGFDSQTQTGAEFRGNRVILHYVDGQRGDNDGQANGKIEDPGGPAIIVSANNSSSSGGGGCSLTTSPGRPGIPVDFALMLFALLARHILKRKFA